MYYGLSETEFKLFQSYISKNCGIDIGDDKAYLIETRLSGLLNLYGLTSFHELFKRVENGRDTVLSGKIINAITTNETSWFRDKGPWSMLEKELLPKYIDLLRRGVKDKVRIWSAAASTGQEAYSIAMCIDNYLERQRISDIGLENFEIMATDISGEVIETAKQGSYDALSISRGLDEYYREKYFTKNGNRYCIAFKIKQAVNFFEFNLQRSFSGLGMLDIIFCRYVMIYFTSDLKIEVWRKLKNAMQQDGILFIGISEIYPAMEEFFEMNYIDTLASYKIKGSNGGKK